MGLVKWFRKSIQRTRRFSRRISRVFHHQSNKDNGKLSNTSESTNVKEFNLQKHFVEFNTDKIPYPKESLEYIKEIEKWAKAFEDKVANYSGTNYSVDYFTIDENLTRFVECLDRIKLQENKPLLEEKIRVIEYIRELQLRLDANVTED